MIKSYNDDGTLHVSFFTGYSFSKWRRQCSYAKVF